MNARQALWPLSTLAATAAILAAQRSGWLPAGWWLLPWALSLVCFGLPHGAVDHDVILRLRPPSQCGSGALIAVLAIYLAVCLLVLGGWFLAPRVWFAGFIALTWAHWGLADLWWSWDRDPAYFRSRTHRAVFALWRGALPMLVPLAADPELFRQTAAATCTLFLHGTPDLSWLGWTPTRSGA